MNLPLPQSKFGDKYRENFDRIFGGKEDNAQFVPCYFVPCWHCGGPVEVGTMYCGRPECQKKKEEK